jgi:hypothetical protein
MPVALQESTATMTAHYAGARPAISYARRGSVAMAVLHQGRSSGPIVSGRIQSAARASAIKLTASMNVLADSIADIQQKYEFHLLQLAWKPIDYALYAGMTASDGSMKLDFAAPPLFPGSSSFLLDADENGAPPFPFVEAGGVAIRSGGSPGAWVVSLEFHDHPFTDRPLALPNFATRSARGGDDKKNYLYQVERSLFFFNAFVVKDLNNGVIKPIGFINWKSRLVAKIRWRINADGAPEAQPAELITSYFTSDDYLTGTPNSAAEKMIVNPPMDPAQTYNALETATFGAVLMSLANSPNIQANSGWSASVPATHFAP